jgi:sugar transferase (PEP-CTERM/EpsH1 system associated)
MIEPNPPMSSPRPNILYLVHRVPYPLDKGDRIRNFNVLKWLSRRAAVYLACLADEPTEEETVATLGRYCERLAVVRLGRWSRRIRALVYFSSGRTVTEGAFSSPDLRAVLRRWTGDVQFQASLASASSMIPYLRMPELRDVPAVVDLMDVDSQKWLDYAGMSRGTRAWMYQIEGRRLRRIEEMLPSWTRGVTFVCEAEADIYRGFCDGDGVHVVGIGTDLDRYQGEPSTRGDGCIFIGSLEYKPNVDGICWFCREVWPEVHRRLPRATLSLVGRRPARAVRRLEGMPGIVLVGQVPDVRPYLSRAAVSIVPLRIARGIQLKMLESLAMGKATIATPMAIEGLGLEPGVHVLAASSPAEWVEALVRLLQSPDLRARIGSSGRHFVEQNHDWDACLQPLSPLLGVRP